MARGYCSIGFLTSKPPPIDFNLRQILPKILLQSWKKIWGNHDYPMGHENMIFFSMGVSEINTIQNLPPPNATDFPLGPFFFRKPAKYLRLKFAHREILA